MNKWDRERVTSDKEWRGKKVAIDTEREERRGKAAKKMNSVNDYGCLCLFLFLFPPFSPLT